MRKATNVLSSDEEVKRRKYYDMGYIDKDIAKMCGYSKYAIADWRRSRGLPAHGGSGLGGKRYNSQGQEVHIGIKRRQAKCK